MPESGLDAGQECAPRNDESIVKSVLVLEIEPNPDVTRDARRVRTRAKFKSRTREIASLSRDNYHREQSSDVTQLSIIITINYMCH